MNKAVFLDRDGVINVDTNYPYKLDDLVLIDKSAEAIKLLNDAGYLVFIITNQSGIGRGYYTMDDCNKFNDELLRRVNLLSNGLINDIRICPHKPDDHCTCRKPSDYFYKELIDLYDVNTLESFVIGDKDTDLIPGEHLGMFPIKITNELMSKYSSYSNLYLAVTNKILRGV